MPRESVRAADYNFVPMKDGADPTVDEPWHAEARLGQVNVGWEKDRGYVEIGTTDETMVYGPEGLLNQINLALIDGTDVEKVVRDFFTSSGFWMTLDRDGCNRLIRIIRKARDGAFGADA